MRDIPIPKTAKEFILSRAILKIQYTCFHSGPTVYLEHMEDLLGMDRLLKIEQDGDVEGKNSD